MVCIRALSVMPKSRFKLLGFGLMPLTFRSPFAVLFWMTFSEIPFSCQNRPSQDALQTVGRGLISSV
jgi:hypothetical protein